MQRIIFLLTVLLINQLFVTSSQGESLNVIDKMTLSSDKATYTESDHGILYVTGVYLSNDTSFVTTNAGLLAKFSSERPWRRLLDREPWGNNWWEDFKKAQKQNVLFNPGYIWRLIETDEMVVFDNHIGLLYTINLQNRDKIKVKLWKDPDEKSIVHTVRIWNDVILFSIISDFHDYFLAMSRPDLSDYRRLFECPPELKRKLDSVWADPECFPAFDPVDSTIWLAFYFYNYIYRVFSQTSG